MWAILYFLACEVSDKGITHTSDTSLFDTALSTYEDSSQRFLLNTSIFIQRSGFISIWDRELGEEAWRLENNSDMAWPEARLSPDGVTLWHNEVDAVSSSPTSSKLVQRGSDGTILKDIEVAGAHHSFDFVGEDHLVTLVTDIRGHDTYGPVAGDALVLVDTEGNQSTLISVHDVLYPEPITEMWNGGNLEGAIDWTHANAVAYYPNFQHYLVTIPGINAIWQISSSGDLERVFLGAGVSGQPYFDGPRYSQRPFDILEGGNFSLPHGANLDSFGRLWLMSNGLGNQTPSFAECYDVSGNSLQLVHQYGTNPEGAHSPGLGTVIFLENPGNVLINWGIWGVIEEREINDDPIWKMEAPFGEVYGFTTTAPALNKFN